jgi:serine/threonine protein phosphatase PrpC
MGTYLSKPVTDKDSEEGELHACMQYGACAMQGWRRSMEDEHIAVELGAPPQWTAGGKAGDAPPKVAMFAVWDGHGGKEVAKYVRRHMHQELVTLPEYQRGDIDGALVRVFHRMDEMLWDPTSHGELDALKKDGAGGAGGGANAGGGAGGVDMDEDGGGEEADGAGERERSDSMSTREVLELFKTFLAAQQGTAAASAKAEDGDGDGGDENGNGRGAAAGAKRTRGGGGDDQDDEDDDDMVDPMTMLRNRIAQRKGGGQAEEDGEEDGGSGAASSSSSSSSSNRPQICRLPDVKVTAGCTSVVAVVVDFVLYVANAGDSRGVLCRGGEAVALSEDHKPADAGEIKRIEAVGGFVSANGRVNGNLNLSRSIGDLKYKQSTEASPADQMITAQPDVRRFELAADDEFMVLACDGIWDCMTNQDAVDFVRQRLQAGMSPVDITKEACDACLSEDPRKTTGIGGDNMTCMVVVFKSLS